MGKAYTLKTVTVTIVKRKAAKVNLEHKSNNRCQAE